MRRIDVLFTAIAMVALSPNAIAHVDAPAAGRGSLYWSYHSVVYAEVKRARRSPERETILTVHPLGTLSGRFDAGSTIEMSVERLHFGLFAPELSQDRMPIAGDKILLVLEQNGRGVGGFTTARSTLAFMPGQQGDPLRIVTQFSDPEVAATLKSVQESRRQDDTVGRSTWRDLVGSVPRRVVVCAELAEVTPEAEALKSGSGSDKRAFGFNLLRVLSGRADIGDPAYISAQFLPSDDIKRFRSMFKVPRVGAIVIATLELRNHLNRYFVSSEPAGFMPGDRSPICEIRGLADPKVAETMRALEISNYWETHSLVYAEFDATTQPGQADRLTVELRPKLTLSGGFDAGKTPDVSAALPLQGLRPHLKVPSVVFKVLVVLLRTGDTYSVSPERPSFMPGDHAPICTVKDFDDPKVRETLAAVQKLRQATSDAAPKGEPRK